MQINQDVAQFTAIYDPHSLSRDDFIAGFVARNETLQYFTHLLEGPCLGSCHQLILGARGMGKTTLLRRIAIAISEEENLREKWIPITFREEQYNVRELRFFWKNTCDSLAQWCEENGDEKNADILDELQDQTSTEATTYQHAIEEICEKHSRRLVLLVDNLDLILQNLKDEDQWALRKVLSRKDGPVMIAATPATINSLSDKNKAFYDYFHIEDLSSLSEFELRQCLTNIAQKRGAPGKLVLEDLNKNPARLKILHNYTDGNPRTLVLMYRVLESISSLGSNAPDDFMPLLLSLIESVTPLYKARTEEFSQQQRQIIDALALGWDPQTRTSLAEKSGIPPTNLPPQLKRLQAEGVIEEVVMAGKKKGLQLRERFYNIWYLMRNGSRRCKSRLIFLTRSIEDLFTYEERLNLGQSFLRQPAIPAELGIAVAGAMEIATRRDIMHRVLESLDRVTPEVVRHEAASSFNALINENMANGSHETTIADSTRLIDLEGISDELRADALISRGIASGRNEDYKTAINDFTAVIDLPEASVNQVAIALLNRGIGKSEQGDTSSEINDFTALINLPKAPVNLVAIALFNRGIGKGEQGDTAGEINDYTMLIDLPKAPVGLVAKALLSRGIVKNEQEDTASEINDYTALIDLPEAPIDQVAKALLYRGISKGEQGNTADAINDYTALIDLPKAPVDLVAKALLNRGVVKSVQGDTVDAITDYTSLIDLPEAPVDHVAEALLYRGDIKREQGDIVGAINDNTTLIDLPEAPVDQIAGALFNRGHAKNEQGDTAGVITDLTALLDLPQAPTELIIDSLLNRGATKELQGDTTGAISDYTAVINFPDASVDHLSEATHRRGKINYERGLITAAIDDLKSALKLDDQNSSVWNTLGNIYLDHTHNYSESIVAFEVALKTAEKGSELYPLSNICWYNLITGDLASAREQREKLPNPPEVAIDLIDSAIALLNDNFGLAIQHLSTTLARNDTQLWGNCQDDLLRLVRLFKRSGYGEKLLASLKENKFSLKHAPFYYAVKAYVISEDLLNNVNPEIRKIAQPLYDWLNLEAEVSDE